MRSKLLAAAAAVALMGSTAAMAGPTYYYSFGGNYFGSLTVDYAAGPTATKEGTPISNALKVTFTAANPGISFEVTGFAFDFNPEQTGLAVWNPTDAASLTDQNSLDWIKLTNLSAIPNPPPPSSVDKDFFEFGVTEGNASNINPPGITAGQTDVYYLTSFNPGLTSTTNLESLIDYAGIRIQSLPNGINGGSLFLVGSTTDPNPIPAPEPATLALFGAGLAGLGFAMRRRRRV